LFSTSAIRIVTSDLVELRRTRVTHNMLLCFKHCVCEHQVPICLCVYCWEWPRQCVHTCEACVHGFPTYSCDVCNGIPHEVADYEEIEADNTYECDEGIDVTFEDDEEAFPQYFLQRVSDRTRKTRRK